MDTRSQVCVLLYVPRAQVTHTHEKAGARLPWVGAGGRAWRGAVEVSLV